MTWRTACERLSIPVTPEKAAAMDELEARGLGFMQHFGTESAVDVLQGINMAMDAGVLYQWMKEQLGVVTQ